MPQSGQVFVPSPARDFISPSIAIAQMRPDFGKILQEAQAANLQRQQMLAQHKLLQQKAQLNDLLIQNLSGAGAVGADPVQELIARHAGRRSQRPIAVLPGQPPSSEEIEQPLPGEEVGTQINPKLNYSVPLDIFGDNP
jgi:hypothetical protein